MGTTTAQVTVYTRRGCVACMATFRALTRAGIEYEAIDTTDNEVLEDELRARGHKQMPVVVTPIDLDRVPPRPHHRPGRQLAAVQA